MIDGQSARRMACAAVLSLCAHAGVALFASVELPEPSAPDLPLAVSLAEVPAPRRATAAPAPVAREAEPRTPSLAARPHKLPSVPAPPSPAPASSDGPAVLPSITGDAAGEPADAERASSADSTPQEPVVVANVPASTVEAAPPAASLPAFPRRGRVRFQLLYGPDGFPVGRTEQSWQIEGGRYELASRSETTGLAHLLRAQHRTYLSRGELTAEGFRPQTFLMSRDRGRGPEEARASFDWALARVTLGRADQPRSESLPHGTQDLVSFMYQLALDPPAPGHTAVHVTNGTKLERYELRVGAEERIETPLGLLRARPVTQVRQPEEESVEVWLATEYRHLPVRIRFFDREGRPAGEQIVTEIRLTEE